MNPPKVLIWTNMPNHYQSGFHSALRNIVDLRVCYYDKVPAERVAMGWSAASVLPAGEQFTEAALSNLEQVPDWKDRLHVLPGYGSRFLRQLAVHLSAHHCQWVHWSEPSHPGPRGLASLPIKRWYAHQVNHHAMGAFANGRMAAVDFARWGIRADRIALLTYSTPQMPDGEPDRECEEFRGNRKAFLFVGAMNRRKGIDILLQAFARIARETSDWVLLLTGPLVEEYVELCRRLEITDRILFRGPVTSRKIGAVMRAADVFVLPSRFDGWGVALSEAAACGMPLIATDSCGAAHHLIEHGLNGYRVRSRDIDSLVIAMQSYIASPIQLESHGERSRELAKEFSPQRNAERFLTAIEYWRTRKAS